MKSVYEEIYSEEKLYELIGLPYCKKESIWIEEVTNNLKFSPLGNLKQEIIIKVNTLDDSSLGYHTNTFNVWVKIPHVTR